MAVTRLFVAANVVAAFDETPGGGHELDFNAPRNAPAKYPEQHLDKLYYHSSFDFLEVAVGPADVTVNHAAVAAGGVPPTASIAFAWNAASADHLLVNHGLGYPPQAMVMVDGNLLWPGMPVQIQADGGARYVSFYVTAGEVRLYEYASIGATTLAAINLTYTVLVFQRPTAPVAGAKLLQFTRATGLLKLARDKIASNRRYLQVVAGGTPYGIALGRTIDLNNGAPRAFRPDGSYFEPVPASLRLGLNRPPAWPSIYGDPMVYGGSYAGPARIQVKAP